MAKKIRNRQTRQYEVKVTEFDFGRIKEGVDNYVTVADDRKEGYEIGDLLVIHQLYNGKKTGELITKTVSGVRKSGKWHIRGSVTLSLIEEQEGN